MEDFRELGNRYLKQNKKRSFITVLGCMIVAMLLFVFLNCISNWVDRERAEVRKTDDFEILILTDDREKIEAIVNEDFVRSAYMGKAYSWTPSEYVEDPEDPGKEEEYILYANALHINVKEVVLVKYYNKYIQKTYDVHTELNNDVLWTYMMDENGSGGIFILGGLFIAYIFAIIGVGIVRNSVQLSALERIKDYGNLRCIGATKKQIRAIVLRESFILESIGIAGGVILGYLISIPICMSRELPADFHFIPIFLLAIAFYGDMYFAIGDGIKPVLKVNPIEAVKGNFRIKIKKNKVRNSGIWKLMFGIEGDYAYKNIKRNNGRFIKTVLAMSFGLGTVVVIGGILGVLMMFLKDSSKNYGYYQQYIQARTMTVDTSDEMKAQLYSADALKKISKAKGIDAIKYSYRDTVFVTENEWLYSHLNEDYKIKAMDSLVYDAFGAPPMEEKEAYDSFVEELEKNNEVMKKYRDSGEGLVDYAALEVIDEDSEYSRDASKNVYKISYGKSLYRTSLDIAGYDDEDYARCADYLVDGTMNLSPNGILLVNQNEIYTKDEYNENANGDYVSIIPQKDEYTFTDLKVGDEITIVDPGELTKLIQEELKRAAEYDESMAQKEKEWDKLHGDEVDENGEEKINPYSYYSKVTENTIKQNWIIESARQKLVEEGKYKTYVIEGIIKDEPNHSFKAPTIIVPLDKYYEMTSQTSSDYTGMMFHISNIFSSDLNKQEFINAIHDPFQEDAEGYFYSEAEISEFTDLATSIVEGMKQFLAIGVVILIVVLVSAFNTMNTAISNIQLRRNEFAQLRALGMTRNGLMKAVVLEGGIAWFCSSVVGLVVGLAIEYFIHYQVFVLIINSDMYIAWIPILIAILLEFIVLCGTNIVCIRGMNLNVANELTRSGE